MKVSLTNSFYDVKFLLTTLYIPSSNSIRAEAMDTGSTIAGFLYFHINFFLKNTRFQQHVNQDTSWDIPGSPEPTVKMDGSSGPPPWKPTVNNGTELWEANLRNGGQPPPQPQQKTPWGHTPSTNIGGTWGEDDDGDSTNVWNGGNSNQQQWGGSGNSNNGPMWGGKLLCVCLFLLCPKLLYETFI